MATQSCSILFRKKRLRELRFKILPHCRIHQIVPVLNAVAFYPILEKKDHISYALMELINNALRAHREKGVKEPILVRLQARSSYLRIEVKDKGGRFRSPKKLPYNPSTPASRQPEH